MRAALFIVYLFSFLLRGEQQAFAAIGMQPSERFSERSKDHFKKIDLSQAAGFEYADMDTDEDQQDEPSDLFTPDAVLFSNWVNAMARLYTAEWPKNQVSAYTRPTRHTPLFIVNQVFRI